ncbi:endonuclease/exonuclease/phosphatase family protein [Streptomyces sp. NPDC001978]|uniref:endonuclease/exonuclease/phosphatase family protein n=1 Tax=Streptomyces sp. NPDC001978 TaxID=3364627 RepID=UPI003684C415
MHPRPSLERYGRHPHGGVINSEFGTLRVATWNLWWRYGQWQARHAAILATLSRLQADVIVLNEVWEEVGGVQQADELARDLKMHAMTCCRPHDQDVLSGNAVLSRWPLLQKGIRKLSATRSVLHAEIGSPYGPLSVFGTHLSWRPDESGRRQEEVGIVLDFISEKNYPSLPPILMGDFNATPGSDELRRLTGQAASSAEGPIFFDAWEQAGDGSHGYTWTRANPYVADEPWPARRIDYVLPALPATSSPAGWFVPERCWIEGTEPVGGIQPSDHYAVAADLRCVLTTMELASEHCGVDHAVPRP